MNFDENWILPEDLNQNTQARGGSWFTLSGNNIFRFNIPLLSSLPETSAARCEANVAELLAVQLAMKTASCLKFLRLCGPLRYRIFSNK